MLKSGFEVAGFRRTASICGDLQSRVAAGADPARQLGSGGSKLNRRWAMRLRSARPTSGREHGRSAIRDRPVGRLSPAFDQQPGFVTLHDEYVAHALLIVAIEPGDRRIALQVDKASARPASRSLASRSKRARAPHACRCV